jgi:hypothetical protein
MIEKCASAKEKYGKSIEKYGKLKELFNVSF